MKPGRVTREAGERQRAEGVARRVSRQMAREREMYPLRVLEPEEQYVEVRDWQGNVVTVWPDGTTEEIE